MKVSRPRTCLAIKSFLSLWVEKKDCKGACWNSEDGRVGKHTYIYIGGVVDGAGRQDDARRDCACRQTCHLFTTNAIEMVILTLTWVRQVGG